MNTDGLQDDLDSLPVVVAVRTALADAPTLNRGLHLALTHIGESLGWLFGACWLVDTGAEQLYAREIWCARAFKSDFDLESTKHQFTRGEGLPGRVWEAGAPVWIEDVLQDSNFHRKEAAAREGLRSAVAFPLRSDGAMAGVFEFYTDVLRTPTPALVPTLYHLGDHIGRFVAGHSSPRRDG